MAKVRVLLTLSEEPFEVDEDEIPGLTSQGLYVSHANEQPAPQGAAKKPKEA